MKRLLLFDIDGTLLTTNGRGREAFQRSIEEVFGRPFDPETISFAGKTDQRILREILSQMGLREDGVDGLFQRALALYTDTMTSILDESWVSVLPGIEPLLSHLAGRPGIQLGLLTGNLEETAYLKLRLAGLEGFFPFGAFGSDDPDRYQLPRIATRRAFDHTGVRYSGHEIVIIGDTEHDIRCGHAIGAFSVAVCTGLFGRDELAPHAPDLLLDDLRDTGEFLRLLSAP